VEGDQVCDFSHRSAFFPELSAAGRIRFPERGKGLAFTAKKHRAEVLNPEA
jgi:hypothetical protein